MEAHFKWLKVVDNPFEGRENAFECLNVLGFMEYIIHRQAGSRTPQSVLYAVDFFGKALVLKWLDLTSTEPKGCPQGTQS